MLQLIYNGFVEFTGIIPYTALPRYIGASDVAVNTLTHNKLCEANLKASKTYEYAACERPIVEAIDFSLSIEQWAGDSMYFVPPESPDKVADAIECVLSNSSLDLRAARRFVEEYRSWEAVTASTMSIIEDSLRQRAASS